MPGLRAVGSRISEQGLLSPFSGFPRFPSSPPPKDETGRDNAQTDKAVLGLCRNQKKNVGEPKLRVTFGYIGVEDFFVKLDIVLLDHIELVQPDVVEQGQNALAKEEVALDPDRQLLFDANPDFASQALNVENRLREEIYEEIDNLEKKKVFYNLVLE